jgi:hypothetical protein
MAAKVEVLINPDGSFEVKVEGVKGQSCTSLTRGLLQRLGPVKDQTLTGEYYEKPGQTRQEIRKS